MFEDNQTDNWGTAALCEGETENEAKKFHDWIGRAEQRGNRQRARAGFDRTQSQPEQHH